MLQTSAAEGMITLKQNLKQLVQANLISKETAQAYIIGGDKFEDEPADDGKRKKRR